MRESNPECKHIDANTESTGSSMVELDEYAEFVEK